MFILLTKINLYADTVLDQSQKRVDIRARTSGGHHELKHSKYSQRLPKKSEI